MSGQQRWCSFNLGAVVNLLFSNNVLVACVTEAFFFCRYQEATEEELEKLLDRIMVLFRFIHGAYHLQNTGLSLRFQVAGYITQSIFLLIPINPFAPGNVAGKRVLKLFKWFSGHCRAIKS